jgi:hypothetical protein
VGDTRVDLMKQLIIDEAESITSFVEIKKRAILINFASKQINKSKRKQEYVFQSCQLSVDDYDYGNNNVITVNLNRSRQALTTH